MGLAAYGSAAAIADREAWLEGLDWSRAFLGRGKREWEESGQFQRFADLAASAQQEYESDLMALARRVRRDFPEYERLILTGGCALNCAANRRLLQSGLFQEVYVPPFPGDESIGFGAASHLYYGRDGREWSPLAHEEQAGYFGPSSSVPSERDIDRAFAGLEIEKPASIAERAAGLLAEGRVLAWFQGRSESGPRALGNRSILADPRVAGIRDRLNREVKFREAFRPYGASCLHRRARDYFDLPMGFNSPYMSFAVRPRPEHREPLSEVCHVDGTSRIQTVRRGQNERFHELLEAFERETGLPCLLNTSLNVMGEPIVETAQDARRLLESTPVDALAIGDHLIRRRTA